MKINHAILHILDFDSAVNVMSQRELDIESRTVRNFVTTHLRRARTSADNKRATFAENSAFGGELKGYFFGEREFVDLSQQIAEFISSELTKAEKAESTDVLVADFDDDEDARWFAVMLLGSKQAFMHEVGREEGEVRNDIARPLRHSAEPLAKGAELCHRARKHHGDRLRGQEAQDCRRGPYAYPRWSAAVRHGRIGQGGHRHRDARGRGSR